MICLVHLVSIKVTTIMFDLLHVLQSCALFVVIVDGKMTTSIYRNSGEISFQNNKKALILIFERIVMLLSTQKSNSKSWPGHR